MIHCSVDPTEAFAREINNAKSLDQAKQVHTSIQSSSQCRGSRYLANLLMQTYGRFGCLDQALTVFAGIQNPNSFSWNILLQTYARAGHLEEARRVFDRMPSRDVIAWTALMTACVEQGFIRAAWRIFKKMPVRNIVAWNAIIYAIAQAGYYIESDALFNAMPVHDDYTLTVMLACYLDNGQTDRAAEVFHRMGKGTLVAWNALLAAFTRVGDLCQAKDLFEAMPARNLVSWNSVLQVYLQAGLIDALESAFSVSMPEHSEISCVVILQGCGRTGRLETSKSLFDSMPWRSVVSWTTLLKLYVDSSQLTAAKELFDRMPERSSITWSVMLQGCAQLLDAERIFETTRGTTQDDPACISAWTNMINLYADHGRLDDARAVFDSMPGRDMVAWNTMLACYNRDIHRCKDFFDQMPCHNLVSHNTLLSAMAASSSSGSSSGVEAMLSRMPVANVVTFALMIRAYASAGQLSHAKITYETMPERNEVALITVILALAENGYVQSARAAFDRSADVRDLAAWSAIVAVYVQNGRASEAVELFREMILLAFDPDETIFTTVLASAARQLDRCWRHYVSMIDDFGIPPRPKHYCCLVDAMARAGQLEQAMELVQFAMPDQSGLWMLLLGASKIHRNAKIARSVTGRLIGRCSSNETAYILLANPT